MARMKSKSFSNYEQASQQQLNLKPLDDNDSSFQIEMQDVKVTQVSKFSSMQNKKIKIERLDTVAKTEKDSST